MIPEEARPALRGCTEFTEIAGVLVDLFGFEAVYFEHMRRGEFRPQSRRSHWTHQPPASASPGWFGLMRLQGGDAIWQRAQDLHHLGMIKMSHVERVEFAPPGEEAGERRLLGFTVWLDAETFPAMWVAQKLREGLVREAEE